MTVTNLPRSLLQTHEVHGVKGFNDMIEKKVPRFYTGLLDRFFLLGLFFGPLSGIDRDTVSLVNAKHCLLEITGHHSHM